MFHLMQKAKVSCNNLRRSCWHGRARVGLHLLCVIRFLLFLQVGHLCSFFSSVSCSPCNGFCFLAKIFATQLRLWVRCSGLSVLLHWKQGIVDCKILWVRQWRLKAFLLLLPCFVVFLYDLSLGQSLQCCLSLIQQPLPLQLLAFFCWGMLKQHRIRQILH